MKDFHNTIRDVAEGAINKSRGESFEIDSEMSPFSVLAVTGRKAVEAARGLIREPMLKGSGRPLFLGSRVRILHPRLVTLGRGCSIGDSTLIDALSREGIVIGDNVTLGRFVTVRVTGTIKNLGVGVRIGNNSSLGAFSYVGAAGGVNIGDNVMMGPFVGIYAENHRFDDMDIDLIRDQGVTRAGITIGDNCWIGSSAIFLDGVVVGTGCVVGAGSVVVDDIDDDCVVAGVPARVIRKRGEVVK